MGSVAVLKMDASVNPAGQVEPKRIHPFFAPHRPPTDGDPIEPTGAHSQPSLSELPTQIINESCEDGSSGNLERKNKRRKVEIQEEISDEGKSPKRRVPRRSKGGSTSGADIVSRFEKRDAETAEPASAMPTKVTHPFFTGKAKVPSAKPADTNEPIEVKGKSSGNPSAVPPKKTQFSSTPCSPKKSKASAPSKMPNFGTKNSGLKFPGAKMPAWPWKDTVHIRGEDTLPEATTQSSYSLRKSKGHAVSVPATESLMVRVTEGMEIPAMHRAILDVNGDNFAPAPPELRLPLKHFESGRKLQQRIFGELRCTGSPKPFGGKKQGQKNSSRPDLDVDQSSTEDQLPPQTAPLFSSVRTNLSAFDKSRCETSMWTQKYAPGSASEVLQPGREVFMLRDWLQALTVQAVHTGTGDGEKTKKGKTSAPKKKKKKKLDDFIVSSDEEDNEMNEVSDGEADWSPSGPHGLAKKTVIRSGDLAGRGRKEGTRVTNVVVISGPHGCGKTAAVYAVAKELDFEIFEINSSSRRSGKDIMERIGDMTTNHLVQQQQTSEQGKIEVPAADETEKEVKSGKQATMNAFFKATPSVPKPKQMKPAPAKPAAIQQDKEQRKEASKSQKQSLILLDEADILYDKDQQFWSTVVTLAAQSKRPFVVTCNDETLLPLHTLALHAIMRFSPPPVDLAVDRLLLIAANEGHALKRGPVEALYESCNRDLRAATTDLNYWCQIGIGDRRGGFEWFFPRWPKGADLDENQDVVRVVSEDSYQLGMNWLGRDSIACSEGQTRDVEEQLLSQAWSSWQLDLEHWHNAAGLHEWVSASSNPSVSGADRLKALEAYDELADAMSAADLSSSGSFGGFKQECIDATLPPISDKAREDFICGLRPLDAPILTRYELLGVSIPATISSLARAALGKRFQSLDGASASELPPLGETQVLDSIRTRFISVQPYTPRMARIDIAFAFDPIAVADAGANAPISYLDPSVFDRTMKLIVLDVAPFVRGIVAYETHLQKQRQKLSSVLSESGRNGQGKKRMRTTRAALSALEGSSRSTTRGERWFKADMNPFYVTKTAGEGWQKLVMDMAESLPGSPARSSESRSPSPPSSKGRKRKVKAKKVLVDESADEIA